MKQYGPNTHFFTDHNLLAEMSSANFATDAFGPVGGNETTRYRTTSFVRATTQAKVFAICGGQILIQPQTEDATKVNLILKPNPSESFYPLKIKYFIYRGVNKADLIDGDNLQPINEGPTDQPTFLFNLWKEFVDFNQPFFDQGIITEPLDTFPAFLIGYTDDEGTTSIERFIRRTDSNEFYQFPTCQKGEYLGKFSGRIGLDVVLDYGDYELTNQEELFRLDLDFARKSEHIFDTATIPDSTPTKVKRYKEYIHQFLDAAAFWGSHIECGEIRSTGVPEKLTINSDIFTHILKKYQTKNKLYFYILAERTRSYNYYNTTREIHGIDASPITNDTNGWPIIIIEKTFSSSNHNLKIGLDYSISRSIASLNRNVSLAVITSNNDLSVYPKTERKEGIFGYIGKTFAFDTTKLFNNETFVKFNKAPESSFPEGLKINDTTTGLITGTPTTHEEKEIKIWAYKTPSQVYEKIITIYINPIIETLPMKFAFNETKSCANFVFIFADTHQEYYPNEYYNNLWPVNLGSTFKIPDNEQNLTHWLNYDKNQIKNFDVIQKAKATIVQQKIIFDNGINQETVGPNLPTKKRRTYVTGIKSESVLKTQLFRSGFEKRILDSRVYSYRLFNDTSFVFYKGTFIDHQTQQIIQSLTLFNNDDYTKKFNYLLLGITEEEYNKLIYDNPTPTITPPNTELIQILPKDADNVFFYLEEDYEFIKQNVKKFKLGLQYEDNAGVLQILYPSENNSVYVYTIDGYFFCSPEYTDYQQFYKILPKVKAEFRVTHPYAGEFGFDWMRVGDTGAPGDVDFADHVGKLYYDEDRTKIIVDSNEDHGFFKKDDLLYQKLELEYTLFPIQYKNEEEIQKYYVPKLSIYPEYRPVPSPGIDLDKQPILGSNPDLINVNRIAKISLNISIITSPQSIELQYDTNVLEVINLTGPFDLQELDCTYDLTIRSIVSFGTPQIIKVTANYGDGFETIGVLVINPNASTLRYFKELLIVEVKTNINNLPIPPELTIPVEDHAKHLKMFLRQIFTTPQIKKETIDLVHTSDQHFESTYIKEDTDPNSTTYLKNVITGYKKGSDTPENLLVYLYDKLKLQIGETYDKYFKIFLFNDFGGYLDQADIVKKLSGYSLPESDLLADFPNHLASTTTHEFLHTANVQHTFTAYESSKFARFTFQNWKTDNIMDYSDVAPAPNPKFSTISLFKWQGEIAVKKFKPETTVK